MVKYLIGVERGLFLCRKRVLTQMISDGCLFVTEHDWYDRGED